MNDVLRIVASTRLTLAGFVLLALGIVFSHQVARESAWWTTAPLVLLAVNLLAALIVHPRLRRGGLMVFHVALLAVLMLAAVGRLTHFSGRIEIVEGGVFSPADVEVDSRGPLHPPRLQHLWFLQGPFSVDYAPGMKRAHTRSQVRLRDADGNQASAIVGDDTPLVLQGYRFYTTHNKGFAPVITWLPDRGEAQTGTLHMPPYPLFDWKQENRWTPSGRDEIRFWLRPESPIEEQAPWTLDPSHARAVLVVHADSLRAALQPGESVRIKGGTLRYEALRGWMGYKVFFDPTLPWLLAFSVIAVAGLAWHLWGRLGAATGSVAGAPSGAPETVGAGGVAT